MSTISEETMKILTDIDELVMEETEKDSIQYDSIDFILQNVRFANEEIFSDESQILASRRSASNTMVLQMLFYLACILKPFTVRRRVPSILIFGGEGYVGSQLVLKMCEYGLSQYLTVFSRGMLNANHWIAKGIRMISSLDQVDDEAQGKFDIVLYCADLSAFPSVARLLTVKGKINAATAFITCTLGLQRRRVFNFLGTTCVLRTFVEHSDAIKRSYNTLDQSRFLNATKSIRQSLTLTIPLESDFLGSGLSDEAYAADLIARRCNDIRHLIFVIENNYVVRGVPSDKARNYALHMVLGNANNLLESDEINFLKPYSSNLVTMTDVLDKMREPILKPFQEQLSKYIRVMDLPDLLDLTVRVDASEPVLSANLLLDIHNQQHGEDLGSVASGDTQMIAIEDLLMDSDKDDNSFTSSRSPNSHGVDPLDLHSLNSKDMHGKKKKKVPSKLAEKQKEKEEARKGLENLHAEIKKRKVMLEAQRKIQNDDLYNNVHKAMHSEEMILKIFENDLKSETSLIGLPPRIVALIGEIDDENRQLAGTAAAARIDQFDEDLMEDAFEGFIRLPKLAMMAMNHDSLLDVDLSRTHFVSTLRTDHSDDDNDSTGSTHNTFAVASVSASQAADPLADVKPFLPIEQGAVPVLVESFGKKGFVSVLHDRVIQETVQFQHHGGIEVVHEGTIYEVDEENEEQSPKDKKDEKKTTDSKDKDGKEKEIVVMSRQSSSKLNRNASNNVTSKDNTGNTTPVPLTKSNSAKYGMMRGNSSKSMNSESSHLSSPTMSTGGNGNTGGGGGGKPTAPQDTKSSRQQQQRPGR
jgi:hypothetical protein